MRQDAEEDDISVRSPEAQGLLPSEQFLLALIEKLSSFIEALQARQMAKTMANADMLRNIPADYPGLAKTPTSIEDPDADALTILKDGEF